MSTADRSRAAIRRLLDQLIKDALARGDAQAVRAYRLQKSCLTH